MRDNIKLSALVIIIFLFFGFTFAYMAYTLSTLEEKTPVYTKEYNVIMPKITPKVINITASQVDLTRIIDINDFVRACNKDTIQATSVCIQNIIINIIDYELQDDISKRSYNDIIRNGGDCFDYSRLAAYVFERNGHNSEVITIKINETLNHDYVRVYDKTGYCINDMNKQFCVTYT